MLFQKRLFDVNAKGSEINSAWKTSKQHTRKVMSD